MAVDLKAAKKAVERLLEAAGIEPDEHTADTPLRSAKAWAHMLGGYDVNPQSHLATTFPVQGDPGLILITGIEVHSTCAHHLLPITGVATVGYRPARGPEGRVVGLSKLNRLVDGYARRLQVQEQLGRQVADALDKVLWPEGAGCVISALHGCMTIRGVAQAGSSTTTHAWAGGWEDAGHPDRAALLAAHEGSLRR